jgi:hypothetical protein
MDDDGGKALGGVADRNLDRFERVWDEVVRILDFPRVSKAGASAQAVRTKIGALRGALARGELNEAGPTDTRAALAHTP